MLRARRGCSLETVFPRKAMLALSLALLALIAERGARAQPPAAEFAGAAECASCHASHDERWRRGRHSKMAQPATAAAVKGDFSQKEITLRGQRYGLREENGRYFISERGGGKGGKQV